MFLAMYGYFCPAWFFLSPFFPISEVMNRRFSILGDRLSGQQHYMNNIRPLSFLSKDCEILFWV